MCLNKGNSEPTLLRKETVLKILNFTLKSWCSISNFKLRVYLTTFEYWFSIKNFAAGSPAISAKLRTFNRKDGVKLGRLAELAELPAAKMENQYSKVVTVDFKNFDPLDMLNIGYMPCIIR